jgi:hypothetical protein
MGVLYSSIQTLLTLKQKALTQLRARAFLFFQYGGMDGTSSRRAANMSKLLRIEVKKSLGEIAGR